MAGLSHIRFLTQVGDKKTPVQAQPARRIDTFINLAKQGVDAYERSHSDVSTTGGHECNSPNHSQGDHGGGGGPDSHGSSVDEDEVVSTASRESSGDHSPFSSALGFLKQNKDEHERPIDEESVQHAHRKAYQEDSAGSLPASSLGSAAALQVLKRFTSSGSGGGSQTQLISLAMAEASNLFDKSGGASSGNKQDAVNGAAMTVMKLLVQSKFGGSIGGGNSGGLGGLMNLASKFT
ncbi:hypothetical protein V8D89_012914 [Ganoderma adspersum]